jgi:hypothetical protein
MSVIAAFLVALSLDQNIENLAVLHAPHPPRGGVPDVASCDRRLIGIEPPRLRAPPIDLALQNRPEGSQELG